MIGIGVLVNRHQIVTDIFIACSNSTVWKNLKDVGILSSPVGRVSFFNALFNGIPFASMPPLMLHVVVAEDNNHRQKHTDTDYENNKQWESYFLSYNQLRRSSNAIGKLGEYISHSNASVSDRFHTSNSKSQRRNSLSCAASKIVIAAIDNVQRSGRQNQTRLYMTELVLGDIPGSQYQSGHAAPSCTACQMSLPVLLHGAPFF